MRKINLFIILIISIFFVLTSCQKDALEDTPTTQKETSARLGDNAPETDQLTFDGIIENFDKAAPEALENYKAEVTKDRNAATSRNSTLEIQLAHDPVKVDIDCNTRVHGSTHGKRNHFPNSVYNYFGYSANLNGSDQLYSIHIPSTRTVTFNLNNTRENLAMFLYKGDYDVHRRIVTMQYVAGSTSSSSQYSDHIGPVQLTAGNYILVVDGEPSRASDYTLDVICSGGSTTCDDMESYHTGDISPQSNKWEKWKSSNRDGEVKRTNGDQYLKLARTSHGNQQDLIYRTGRKNSGKHKFSMDMWIYGGKSGYMNIQKQLRSEWGGQIYFYSNGTGEVQINGRTMSFNYPQSQWMEVEIEIDFNRNSTKLYINGSRKATWDIDSHTHGSNGSYQIEGIDFYPNASNSEMFIDNVCFKQI